MAPRLKILISSGSKKGTRIYYPFSHKVPASKSPPGYPLGPAGREISACRAFLLLSQYICYCLSLRIPGKGAPSMFPNRFSHGQGYSISRATGQAREFYSFIHSFHSFIHVCWSPQKWALLHTYRKNIRSLFMESHAFGRPTYNGVQPGSRRGLTTMLSLPQYCVAFGTIPSTGAWVDQSPISQHVS